MSRGATATQDPLKEARLALFARLQERRTEIEHEALVRIYAVSDSIEKLDPDYVDGLRATITATIDYGLTVIERGEDRSPPPPAVVLTQARLAAQHGISLDAVLRRYFAGYTLLGDFLIEETEESGLFGGAALQRLVRTQSAVFDQLLVSVTDEYTREAERRLDSIEERRAERVKRLLKGDLVDTSELEYDFDGHHLGVIGAGIGATEAIRDFAKALDHRLLLIRSGEGAVWAWLGSRSRVDPIRLERLAAERSPAQVSLAIGEPTHGRAGWRLTHKQARAALPIATRSPKSAIRYTDVALLASILQDDLLATSLREHYLAPLAGGRDGGKALRETLRAYFAAERNVSSAAAALGVNRHTVTSRLRVIEERLGRPLRTCGSELDAALRLQDLGYPFLSHAA